MVDFPTAKLPALAERPGATRVPATMRTDTVADACGLGGAWGGVAAAATSSSGPMPATTHEPASW